MIIKPNNKFIKCWPLNVIGEPDIIPLSFRNAIIEPEKVIAPIAAPKDISIRLASFISPTIPKLNASGFKKAEIATKTVASLYKTMKTCDELWHCCHWYPESYKCS